MSLNGIILLKSVKNYTENLLKSGIGMLYRKIETVIEEHLKSDSKKILLIDGARQVGKTYIIRYVGKKIFKNFIEINMVEDSLGNRLFENTKTVEDFYLQVSMLAGNKMGKKSDTLIFIRRNSGISSSADFAQIFVTGRQIYIHCKRFAFGCNAVTDYLNSNGQYSQSAYVSARF